jgi:hypothetical protein
VKLPWIKFYPGDWLSDEALRSCSVEARGLWVDMLCLMAKSESHGHLLIGGKPARAEQIARIVGLLPQKTMELMDELNASGVFSFDKETIISRRMVKDERVRKSDASRKMHQRHGDVRPMSRECPENVTGQKLEARSQKLEARKEREGLRPTLPQWIAFAKEIGWSEKDAETAFFYYGSVGWMIGNKPMKNWKLCARTCQRRNQNQKKGGDLMSISSLEFDGMKKVKYENNCNNSK